MEGLSIWELNNKERDAAILERGREEGREEGVEETETKIVEKMVLKGISDADIRVITGVSLSKIVAIRKKLKK